MNVLLRGGQVFQGGSFHPLDLRVDQIGLVELGKDLSPTPDDRVVDISGKYVLPGLADIHVHLREPGFSYKETIATGTAAAARGGFTSVGAMPNVAPPPDNLPELLHQIQAYQQEALIEVFPYGCLTEGGTGTGETVDYAALEPYVIGFSDDGFGVQSTDRMREVMTQVAEVDGIVAQHIEDLEISADGYINDGEYARAHGHKGKPGAAEWTQLERDLALVAETGCRYHACHLSTARSVELVAKAKADGLPVTAETAPHYLVLSEDELEEDGRFRMNPPLRSARDRDAVAQALVDGVIDLVATDHAPHSAEEKAGGLAASANGVVGLENSLAVVYTHFVRAGRFEMERLVEVMGTAPRQRFSLGGGEIIAGEYADLIVFDPDFHEPLDPGQFLSKGKATPFAGRDLYGRVDLTLCQGDPVWDPEGLFA